MTGFAAAVVLLAIDSVSAQTPLDKQIRSAEIESRRRAGKHYARHALPLAAQVINCSPYTITAAC